MTATLDVPDILYLIVLQCNENDSSLADFASASRLLWEVSRPSLWECIPDRHSIEDILHFFSDILSEADKTPQDNRRIQYAQNVRFLTFKSKEDTRPDSLLCRLRSAPLAKLFPNLKGLDITPSFYSDNLFGFLMDGLKLEELAIHLYCEYLKPAEIQSALATVSHAILKDHGNLEALELSINGEDGEDIPIAQQSEIAIVIESLPHLRRLQLEGIGHAFHQHWVAASKLEYLQDVGFFGYLHLHALPTPGPKFKGPLRNVIVSSVDPLVISALLEVLNAEALVQLTLYIDPENMGPQNLDGGLATLQAFQNLGGFVLESECAAMEWEDMVPILACRELEYLSLSARHLRTTLTDSRLNTMALAWPRMQRLSLGEGAMNFDEAPPLPTPAATLQSLCHFATHCKNMVSLTIAVDAHTAGQHVPIPFASEHFIRLDLHSSVGNQESEQFRSFIKQLAPHLDLEAKWLVREKEPEDEAEVQDEAEMQAVGQQMRDGTRPLVSFFFKLSYGLFLGLLLFIAWSVIVL